ncbi:beta-ketoacyl-ACP synthase [Sulfidibacter corallicola]
MAGLCPLGTTWPEVRSHLRDGISGVSRDDALGRIAGMKTRLVAVVPPFTPPETVPEDRLAHMSRLSLMSVVATEEALRGAGLLGHELLGSGRCGISFGSTSGSPPSMGRCARAVSTETDLGGTEVADFYHAASHATAASLALAFEVRGRVIPTNSACTSGSQGIGMAYESIRDGLQDAMIAGGAEELFPVCTAVFDILYATSSRNEEPTRQPRPFDKDRDGLVVGEGAATLILEDLGSARRRGAPILAELRGYATNCDGVHMVAPQEETMYEVMANAAANAGVTPDEIAYVCAHGTATELGDIAESLATARFFGRPVPFSSLKSYMGHTLGACGALEAWCAIHFLNEGWLAPTLNLTEVDPRCGHLDYLREVRPLSGTTIMSNNFAFGGVNTSLILERWTGT